MWSWSKKKVLNELQQINFFPPLREFIIKHYAKIKNFYVKKSKFIIIALLFRVLLTFAQTRLLHQSLVMP